MGCHTWFGNKISCITQEDIDKIRKTTINRIKHSYIYNCTANKWLADIKEDLNELKKSEEDMNSDVYQFQLDFYSKMNSKEYFEKHKKQYVEDLEKLMDENTPKKELFKIFERHDMGFENKNDFYCLDECGWCDNYRVSGYPQGTFHSAEEAIKFLEEYDNGNNIMCGYENGMCDEIREIINNFFKKYPNGSIYYA